MTKPAALELAPFIMEDHQASPKHTRRSINAGIEAAWRKGDTDEADRLEKHLDDNNGATGLRVRRRDTVYQKVSDRRLLRACDTMRNVAEAQSTGRMIVVPPPPESREDEEEKRRKELPAIKNPPRPADPIDRWRTGQPTMKRVKRKDGTAVDVKRACPRTFPPKPVKTTRGMPKQYIAEHIYGASKRLQADARRASLWRVWDVALRSLDPELADIMRDIIIDCISMNRACEMVYATPETKKPFKASKRQHDTMRQHLVGVLERAAQYLEEIS